MSENIKIIFVDFAVVPSSPTGNQICMLVEGLTAIGVDAWVVSSQISESLRLGVNFCKCSIPNIKPKEIRYWWFCRNAKRWIIHLQKRLGCGTIVHSTGLPPGYADVVSKHFVDARVLELIHAGQWHDPFAPRIERIKQQYRSWVQPWKVNNERAAVESATVKYIVAPSEGVRDLLQQYYSIKSVIKIIPNAISLSKYERTKELRIIARKKWRFGDNSIVGIISALGDWHRKGLSCLIRAMPKTDPRIHLIITGNGTEPYEKQARSLGVMGRCRFIGYCNDMKMAFASSDFFILPTLMEAMSFVSMEAAASGLAVLMTDVPGAREVVKDGKTGFLISRSPIILARQLRDFANLPEEERILMGRRAKERVKMYTPKYMIESYMNLYKTLSEGVVGPL